VSEDARQIKRANDFVDTFECHGYGLTEAVGTRFTRIVMLRLLRSGCSPISVRPTT
jgi:hypothetical protein